MILVVVIVVIEIKYVRKLRHLEAGGFNGPRSNNEVILVKTE